jgi:hypothetical protein
MPAHEALLAVLQLGRTRPRASLVCTLNGGFSDTPAQVQLTGFVT